MRSLLKMHFVWPIFTTPKVSDICFGNVRDMWKIYISKLGLHKRLFYDKRPVENVTLSLFSIFIFSALTRLLSNISSKKLRFSRRISQDLPNFNYITKFCDLASLGSKITVLWIVSTFFLLNICKFLKGGCFLLFWEAKLDMVNLVKR